MTGAAQALAPRRADIAGFLVRAKAALGAEHVLTDEAARRLHSIDFSEIRLEVAEAVVRPGSTGDVAALMRAARETGVFVTARGGGMSYTLGYAPSEPGSVVLDMTRMNRILSIDTEDMLVTLEPGVTWAKLADALRPSGCQIGCMGTMSGIAATIGGGLGNNATGHGRGDITDDLMGLEVVLPTGEVALTGALATNPDHPVLRSHGPDFTGVFTHDAGAFGVKTKIVFRLMRRPRGTAFLCYGFQDTSKLVAALCDVERLGVMSSNMAFSDYHHRVFAREKPTPAEAKAMAALVLSSASSKLRGLQNLVCLAQPGGLSYLLKWRHSTFSIIDSFDQAEANRKARAAGQAMRAHGGVKLPAGLGIVMRAQPYMPIEKLMIGLNGECTFPSNCGVVLSQAQALTKATTDFFASNRRDMERHGVTWTRLFLTSKGGFGIEPIIYWSDRPNPLRMSKIAPERREKFEAMAENPDGRAYAIDLRARLVAEVDKFRPYHFQIGKYYKYRDAVLSPAAWAMLQTFKNYVDPDRIMNPGALGL